MLYELEELDIYKALNCIMNVSYDFPLFFEEINVIGSLISIFCVSRQINKRVVISRNFCILDMNSRDIEEYTERLMN